MSLLAQVVFFFLTTLAISGWLLMTRKEGGVVLLIGGIAVAEFLIRRHHFWRTGVESALWVGSLYGFIFTLPSTGKPEALLVLAAAAAIAGWRVRNAIFGALAMILVTAYFSVRDMPVVALAFACGIALVALVGCTRACRRPSTEFLWQVLLMVMPVAGYVASDPQFLARETPVFVALALIFAIAGIRFRIRVPLVAGGIAMAIAAFDAHNAIALSTETKLIMAGAIALSIAAAIARGLRRRTHGFVLDGSERGELEAIAAGLASAAVAAPAASTSPQPLGRGGEFGGAGASGDY